MTFRTPMLRRLAVLCVLAAMLVAATGCTALKNGDDKPDAGASGDLGADLGIAEWDQGPPTADQGVSPVDLGVYDDAGAVDSGVPDLGSPDVGPRCAPTPRMTAATWARYPLPDTAGHPRSYQLRGTWPYQTEIDCVTGLEWQRTVGAASYTQAEAITYCDDLELAGYTDWQLPSTIELMTLVDYTVPDPGPAIDTDAFPGTPAAIFWSSSSAAGMLFKGWFVHFANGFSSHDDVSMIAGHARCVRGDGLADPAMGAPGGHFTDFLDGTVHDNLTMLVWQTGRSPATQSQADAGTYCAMLALAGSAPWRLPTVLELRSLVDESRSAPSIDVSYFLDTPAERFWSSTPVPGGTYGTFVDFGYGTTSSYEVATPFLARCVR